MGTRWSGYGPPVSALIETSLEHRQLDMTWKEWLFFGGRQFAGRDVAKLNVSDTHGFQIHWFTKGVRF